jgi:hypothetical protein
VTAPVLLLGASADPFGMRDLPLLRDKLVNAHSVDCSIIDGGTVPVMEQAPREVASLITEFLRGADARR